MTPEQQAAIDKAQRRREAISAAQSRLDPRKARAEAAIAGTLQASPESLATAKDFDRRALNDMKPMRQKVYENVVGDDDPTTLNYGEAAAAALNKGGESMTLGLVGDEAAAAADAAIGRGTYETRRDFYRQQERDLSEQYPKTALAAEVAPALLPATGIAAAGVKGAVALGAAAGAMYGFMEGEGTQDRVASGVTTGALGGLFGYAAPKIAAGVGGVAKKVTGIFARSQRRPTVDMLKATKNAAYAAVDSSGERFTGQEMADLAGKVRQKIEGAGTWVEGVDTGIDAALKLLDRKSGQEVTLSQLDGIRQNLWKRYAAAKDQPGILDAISEIDALIDSRAGASATMDLARAANARFSKAQLLDDAFEKAADQAAAAGSGGNINNKFRQAVSNVLNNPSKARYFTAAEKDVMRRFVRGSFDENALRLIGKLSPSGNGLMMALHTIGGVASGGATVPLMGIGAGAKAGADAITRRGADNLKDVVAGVAPAQPSNALSGLLPTLGAVPELERMQEYLRQPQR